MENITNGRSIYEKLAEGGREVLTGSGSAEATAEAVEKAAGLAEGAFYTFFDGMDELADVVHDRLVLETMRHCAMILSGSEDVLARTDSMLSFWDEKADEIDGLGRAAHTAELNIKGHILTGIDTYNELAAALSHLISDACTEGLCNVCYPDFAARSVAYGVLASRYSGSTEHEILAMTRCAFDALLVREEKIACAG